MMMSSSGGEVAPGFAAEIDAILAWSSPPLRVDVSRPISTASIGRLVAPTIAESGYGYGHGYEDRVRAPLL